MVVYLEEYVELNRTTTLGNVRMVYYSKGGVGMYSRRDILDILDMAIMAGRILLENGAETYRVEETINRLCRSKGLESVDNFTIPTGIFVSASYGDELITRVMTVRIKTIDLEIIALINDFSRRFQREPMGVAEAVAELERIEKSPHYPLWLQIVAGGAGGSFFALLFGATGLEFPLSFLTAVAVMIAFEVFSRLKFSTFMTYVFSGIANISTALAVTYLSHLAGFHPRVDMLAIGALMPLVPGVAITNAIRDIISGDYVSGMSRLLEAMVIAGGIALGVGIVMHLNHLVKAVTS